MGSFGQDFSQGLALGVNIYDNAQREKRQDQEQQWKAEDRKRETDERSQLDELGKVMGKWEQGDFSPAIAKANSSGMFGPDRYAAGARLGDDGNIYAQVYNAKDPVNSLQDINLGNAQALKNQMVMAHAPPRILATIGVNQAGKQADPEYQQRLQSGSLDNQRKALALNQDPQRFALDMQKGQADLAHSAASTAALNQGMQQSALMGPAKIRETEADAALKERQAANPYYGQKAAGYIMQGDPEDPQGQVRIPIYDPNDPRLQPKALAGPSAPQASTPSFKSADDVRSAFKAGKLSRDQAKSILSSQFGMQ